MPNTSGNKSDQSHPIKTLPAKPSLENLRKQAKTLFKAVRLNEEEALVQLRSFHPAWDSRSEVSLSDAQLVIARSYGFSSWSKLKQQVEVIEYSSLPDELRAADDSESPVDRFISLACLNYTNDNAARRVQARELLAANPALAKENSYAAATVGDPAVVDEMLRSDPTFANRRGGPYNWAPLLYATYSRLNSEARGHSTFEVVKLLLKHGADPNAGFLWDRNYLFTALTGAFGEGEMGPVNQPEHQYCYDVARSLLEAGADPNDGQTLYNRMFTGGVRHLELLFEFGLGKKSNGVWFKRLGDRLDPPTEMLQQLLGWAAKYNHMLRLKLLVENGVDLNRADTRLKRPPYELALVNGNREIAEYLLSHGATKTSLSELNQFSVACINGDEGQARDLLAKDPTLIRQLSFQRTELLTRAAESGKGDAIRLMHSLGFDLNERRRTTPIHLAASVGNLELVKLMIELGADPMIRDAEFNGTALGWANYSGKTEVCEFLISLGCTY